MIWVLGQTAHIRDGPPKQSGHAPMPTPPAWAKLQTEIW